LLLGTMATPTQTALYKVGMAVASGLTVVVDPASAALLPRFSRLWAARRQAELNRLVRHATLISAPLIAALFVLLVVFRDPLLQLFGGGPAASDAGTVLILGALGHAFHAAVFWRTTVLFAVDRAKTVSAVMLPTTALQIAGVALLVPPLGAIGAALAFVVSRALSAVVLSVAAVRALMAEQPPRAAALVPAEGRS
jgi:O-antigen/teichoic acid export membrane protein